MKPPALRSSCIFKQSLQPPRLSCLGRHGADLLRCTCMSPAETRMKPRFKHQGHPWKKTIRSSQFLKFFQKNTIQHFIQNFIQHPISHAAAVWISPSLVMISMEQFFTAMVTFSWLFTSKLPMIPRNSDMGNLLVRPENGGRPCKGGSKKPLFPILPAYLAHWFLTPSSTTSLNKTSIYISFLSFSHFHATIPPNWAACSLKKSKI